MTIHPKPEIATNRAGETVTEALSGFIKHAATGLASGANLDIATVYFNLGGYALLADALDQVSGARLLLGAEPTPPERRQRALGRESVRPEKAARDRLRTALNGHQQALAIGQRGSGVGNARSRDPGGCHFHRNPRGDKAVAPRRSRAVREGRHLSGSAVGRGISPGTASGTGDLRSCIPDQDPSLGIGFGHGCLSGTPARLCVLCPGGRRAPTKVPVCGATAPQRSN